tara:strand:+ start:418 stop:630 length:213 start_codon:yes stop_codon:yes gene_type:complete
MCWQAVIQRIQWKALRANGKTLNNAAKRAGVRYAADILKHIAIVYMTGKYFKVAHIAEYPGTARKVVELS